MADLLTLAAVTLAYGRMRALDSVDLGLPEGRVTVLAGPNGCGKSTLLRLIRRLLLPDTGTVRLEQRDILDLSERELARRMALLSQSPSAPDELKVAELVRLGRFPHQTFFRQWSKEDAHVVERALVATGLEDLGERRLDTLSGGQKQRVWLAMVLAQDTPTVCLDEPTNHLDVQHQLECLDLVRRLNRELGKTVIVVLHDLNLAARYADHLVLMKQGRIRAQGNPAELMREHLIGEVFGIESRVILDPVHHVPLCIPIGSLAGSDRRQRAAE